jgi:pimeloyl-ACP methyl ester carboxylesterase
MSRSNTFLRGLGLAVLGLAVWELRWRSLAAFKARTGAGYWKTYYDDETNTRADELRQTATVPSRGVDLHIDMYPRPEADAPIIIFNHGLGGYSRMFVRLALAFYDLGYTVLLPDQQGQGLSGGRRGDTTVAEAVQNIVDVAQWARIRFGGPIYLAGGSLGGAYAYYAAAAGAPAKAVACLNLFDFGNPLDGAGLSRFGDVGRIPPAAHLLALAIRLLAMLFGWLHVPSAWFARMENIMDDRDYVFHAQWSADPVPPRSLTLRGLASLVSTPPQVPLEYNRTPVLVINQTLDRMVDPQVTQRNFERLGGDKRLVEVPYGHWSNQSDFLATVLAACNEWFMRYK